MRERQRLTSGATEMAPRPIAAQDALLPAAPGATLGRDDEIHRFRENLYGSDTLIQQLKILSLTRPQGFPDPEPVPPVQNGSPVKTAPWATQSRDFLLRLLGVQTDAPWVTLEPLLPSPVEICDTRLDSAQREAVAKAVHTPDVFLIQGLPGTGKSRVVAEIVTQAALKGERILLLAPSPAAIDRVLDLAGNREVLCPVRCLGPNDDLLTLPLTSQALTFATRLRQLSEIPLQCARQDLTASEERCQRRQREEPVFAQLQALAGRLQELGQQAEELVRLSRSPLPIEVEQASAAGESATLHGCLEKLRAAQAELSPRLDATRRLVESKLQRRWWTITWWRAIFHADLAAELSTLQARWQAIQADLETMDRESQSALRQEQDGLAANWQALCRELELESHRPKAPTVASVQTAQTAWREQLEKDEEQRVLAREWTSCLEAAASTMGPRLVRYANLVASTITTLPADVRFGDDSSIVFDLLVLQEADQVSKEEFLKAARRARRWVLVGEPAWDHVRPCDCTSCAEPPRPHLQEAGVRGKESATEQRRFSLSSDSCLQSLWEHLHCDLRKLPYVWIHENDRLCCRLRRLTPEQQPWIESERVADLPEIELRILALPGAKPVLAEVVFPPTMSIAQAKEYIYRELEELPVRAFGSSLCWVEEPEKVVLDLGHAPSAEEVRVPLPAGITEVVFRASPAAPSATNGTESLSGQWLTARIEFDRAAGWQRRRAEEWLRRHLGLIDPGRTIRLEVPHRMQPGLAAFLSELLFGGDYRVSAKGDGPERNGSMPAIEFISVRAAREKIDRPSRDGGVALIRAPAVRRKGGAGLELDLSDPRQLNKLPAHLRAGLPSQGFVNYAEAQAVVRSVQAHVRSGEKVLTVLALYPAQAELIRRLVQQAPWVTPALADAGIDLEISVPDGFRQREGALVLLSLTRSHTHRAVPFGDSPRALRLALTRARSKLVLFGDPGTLTRRSQWDGPLDHLDEASANLERQMIAHLVHYLDGKGPHQHVFQMREDGGA